MITAQRRRTAVAAAGEGAALFGASVSDKKSEFHFGNVISCCKTCNFMKGKLDCDVFLSLAFDIVRHLACCM